MKVKYFIIFIFLGLFSLLYYISCENSKNIISPGNSKVSDLYGHKWTLISFNSKYGTEIRLNSQGTYYLVFSQNGYFEGIINCNEFLGEFKVEDGGFIKIGPEIRLTEKSCQYAENDNMYFYCVISANVYAVNSLYLMLISESNGSLKFIKQ